MVRKAALITLALATSAHSATPDQFDLACVDEKGKAGSHLKIDLAASEWCKGDCREVNKIVSVTSGKIVLFDQRATLRNEMTRVEELNRITGEFTSRYVDAGIEWWDTTETCKPAPYSGIPRGEAKF